MRGEFVDLDGARLYCYAYGQRGAGQPIVLVHGCFTSSHLWQDVLRRLPQGHRVLVLDLLGHGRSDPPREHAMTVAAHADRLERLLDVMGITDATVVGHGLGAAIALRHAAAHPERVAHLLLVNPTLIGATPRDASVPGRVARLARLLPLWRRLQPGWLASALHAALLPGFAHRDTGARALDIYLKRTRTREGRDAACAQLAALRPSRGDTVAALTAGGMRCAIGVVRGLDDPFVTPARAEQLVQALRAATTGAVHDAVLPGVAHVAPEEAPDRLGTIVRELLAPRSETPA
ncbi:MAG: alpha/beta hydrolase [Gemmatimonadetes bacterium]|nr:alpha/beta hydrolase [Gemmatimonadota bacterium]